MPNVVQNKIDLACQCLVQGGLVIIQDDASRENEGDLVCFAKNCTASNINFMITHGKGLICLPLPYDKVDQLNLPMQFVSGVNKFQTPFTVSIDASFGITTGISAHDRALTIRVATADNVSCADLSTPGHIFPLRSHKDGLLGRNGHTEASLALMELAGLDSCAVICEILNEDGTMARTADLLTLSTKFNLPFLTIAEIKEALND